MSLTCADWRAKADEYLRARTPADDSQKGGGDER